MRYNETGYSRNDFKVVGRYQCPVQDSPPQYRIQTPLSVNQWASPLIPMILTPIHTEEVENLDWKRLVAEEEATARVVKPCPWCNKRTYLIDGCNYMDCSKSDPPSNCPGQWCFQCSKPKYNPIPNKKWLGCCNDLTHNSH